MKKSIFYVLASVLSIAMMFLGAYHLIYMKECTRSTAVFLTVYCLVMAISAVSFYELYTGEKSRETKNINN